MRPVTATRVLGVVLFVTTASVAATGVPVPGPADAGDGTQADNGTVATYNGEVAVEDFQVRVQGTTIGTREIVVAFVGSSGATVAQRIGVGQNGEFSANVPLESGDRRLTVGPVTALVLSPGRDGSYGSSGEPPDSTRDLVDFVDDIGRERLTQAQATVRIRRATVDAPGSDDFVRETQFSLAPASTRITGIRLRDDGVRTVEAYEPGETLVVQGVTNRRPDQNAVDVTLRSDGNARSIASALVDQWGGDGVWTTALTVPADATPGVYVLRASDGDSTDSTQIEIVDERRQPTTTTTTTTTATTTTTMAGQETTDVPTTETSETPRTGTTGSPTTGTTSTDGLPGFGLFVAAVGVVLVLVVVARLSSDP